MTDEPPPDSHTRRSHTFAERLTAAFPDGPLDNTALAHVIAATVPGLNAHFRAEEEFQADLKRRLANRRNEDVPVEPLTPPSPTPTTSTFAPREHGWTPEEAAAALTNHQRPRPGRRPHNEQAHDA